MGYIYHIKGKQEHWSFNTVKLGIINESRETGWPSLVVMKPRKKNFILWKQEYQLLCALKLEFIYIYFLDDMESNARRCLKTFSF